MFLRKDFLAGSLFLICALIFGSMSVMTLKLGSATRMGPGFFPLILAGMLGVMGAVILLRGLMTSTDKVSGIPWRGLIAILATPIVFGLTVRGLGLVASLALTVIVAGLANPAPKLKSIAAITVGLTAFCVAVFHYGLGVSIPLFGRWLGF